MNLLFFGGRRRYPGETVSWSEYFGEWLEHPVLAAAALFCVIWMFVRMYGVWKMQRTEKEEQERLQKRYGEPPAKEETAERPSYEDTYMDILPSHRVPDGEVPFEEREKKVGIYEWRIFAILFVLGFMIGMGGSVGGMSDIYLLFMVVILLWIIIIVKHLLENWMYPSLETDGKKRIINWKGLGKKFMPYAGVFVLGLLCGWIRFLLIGGMGI